jgi:hypothetical protein
MQPVGVPAPSLAYSSFGNGALARADGRHHSSSSARFGTARRFDDQKAKQETGPGPAAYAN